MSCRDWGYRHGVYNLLIWRNLSGELASRVNEAAAGLAGATAKAVFVYLSEFNQGLVRVSPEWYWRDFRLRLSRGRNHRPDERLERDEARLRRRRLHSAKLTNTRWNRVFFDQNLRLLMAIWYHIICVERE